MPIDELQSNERVHIKLGEKRKRADTFVSWFMFLGLDWFIGNFWMLYDANKREKKKKEKTPVIAV